MNNVLITGAARGIGRMIRPLLRGVYSVIRLSAVRFMDTARYHAPCPATVSCACPTSCTTPRSGYRRAQSSPSGSATSFLSMMRDGQPPEGWRETWPEILRIVQAGKH